MTSTNGIAARGDDVDPSRRAIEAAPSDPTRVAFALDANQNLVFWRVVALRHANPDKPVRAADLQGVGPGSSAIEKALADLTRKAPGEAGKLVRSRTHGYLPEVDPWTYVQRNLQFAAGCKPAPSLEAASPIDPDKEPGDPLAAVKAFEKAARMSLRSQKWKEKDVHGFHFARREATKGELGETMEWIVANWKAVLKGREFAHLWEDEDDAGGFNVRRRSIRPAFPDATFIGEKAHLFWRAWDRHVRRERELAEAEVKRLKEAQAQAAQYERDAKAATEAGLTVEEWRRQQFEAKEAESRRKLEESRAKNPALQRLMAAAQKLEEERQKAMQPAPTEIPQLPCAVVPPNPRAFDPNKPRWEGDVPFPKISIPTWDEVCRKYPLVAPGQRGDDPQ